MSSMQAASWAGLAAEADCWGRTGPAAEAE